MSDPVLVVEPGDTVRVLGRLTDEGVECPAFRSSLGILFTLAGGEVSALEGLDPGQQAEIRGTVPDVSVCMQGIPLSVVDVELR